MKYTHFATFGGGQLETFNVNPMLVMLVTDNEESLRATLREAPFNNQYCTTYPISYAQGMTDNYDMFEVTLNELLRMQNWISTI